MSSNFRVSVLCLGLLGAAAQAADPGAISTNPAGVPSSMAPKNMDMVEPAPAPKPLLEMTTLKLMLQKGIVTQEEFDTAVKDMQGGATSPTVTVAGWKTTIYGYAELNMMWDSTQSFADLPGGAGVARSTTYAGSHPRFQFGVRDSRLGFRVAAPAWGDVKASGNLEFDLFSGVAVGAIQPVAGTVAVSEGGFMSNPVLRIRHAFGRLDTPIVDLLFGQTWILFGGMPNYIPAVVQIPGVPGEVFLRAAQLRVSKTIKTEFVNIDLALAAMRPVQRDSAMPEGQGLAKISFPKWTGWHLPYVNGTALAPASLSVSGTLRQLALGAPCTTAVGAGATCNSTTTNFITGSGISVDAFIPIVPGKKDDKSNSLSLTGSFVSGTSINDLYTGLTGGVGQYNAALRAATATTPGLAANGPVLDSGLAVYSRDGSTIIQPQWLTSFLNLEYYIPGGRLAILLSWGHTQLNNAAALVAGGLSATAVINHSNFYEAGLVAELTPQIRLAVAYDRKVDVYQDASTFTGTLNPASTASNDSVKGTLLFFF